jgi:glycosyltransferase involved in cell wall biosynthesis
MPDASVIVPARDAESTLRRALDALSRQEFSGSCEVIVVDDGSRDRTVEVARAAPGPVTVIEQAASGPAAARNRGVAAAGSGTLAFCDADCFPTPGWLAAGTAALRSADLVQGRVLPDPTVPLGPFDRTLWVTFEAGLYETANLFVTRETFDQLGGFEEWLRVELGKAMFEDTWFGWRARRAGARTAFAPEALVHHAVFPRGGRDYVAERRRLRYFPAVAQKVPELRRSFFYRRVFLSRRTAALDAALAGSVAALMARSPLPLLACAPYAQMLLRRAGTHGNGWRQVAAVDLAADLVGLASLAHGSALYRSPLI